MIRDLPSRYPEIGRVRLGEKETTTVKGGRTIERPVKGETLRFTSNDRLPLEALSSQLGGEVSAWPDGEQAWQLTSESDSVAVYLPPDPIDTAYERWGAGGIQRRCDGERCLTPVADNEGGHMEESACLCISEGSRPGDRTDVKHRGACQVTVRLRLVLPDVPGLGVWICTSHSWYAALELPGQLGLLQSVSGAGLILAEFAIEARTEKKPWEKFERDYIVPVLRVRASLKQLAARQQELGTGHGGDALEAPALPTSVEGPSSSSLGTTDGSDAASAEAEHRHACTRLAGAMTRIPSGLWRQQWAAGWRKAKLPHSPHDLTPEQLEPARRLVRKYIALAALDDAGVKAEDERHAFVSAATDGATESTKHLTHEQLGAVLHACQQAKEAAAMAEEASEPSPEDDPWPEFQFADSEQTGQ